MVTNRGAETMQAIHGPNQADSQPMKRNRSNVRAARSKRFRAEKHSGKRPTDFDFISESDYIVDGDLMYVRPYAFEFRTNFKPRWRGKTVFDVFSYEFRYAEPQYWTKEFEEGRILSDGRTLQKHHNWEDGMEVVHIVHRHESAVLSQKIHIAHDHQGYVVVSKPPSVPIHPCGTYRRNCLQFILKAFYRMGKLHAVHRLDKETSGLVILAKTAEYAARFSAEIKEHKVRKTYLAEVSGKVKWKVMECTGPVYWDKRELRACIKDEGAEALTSFKRVAVNTERETSIVECQPLTGRTHQIRVHLAHLGHPIVNDATYATYAKPGSSTTVNVSSSATPQSLMLTNPVFQDEQAANIIRKSYEACEWSVSAFEKNKRHLGCLEEGELLSCTNCPQVTNVKNVEVQAMFIHLHALKYESDNWSFSVPPPPWASLEDHDGGKSKTGIGCLVS